MKCIMRCLTLLVCSLGALSAQAQTPVDAAPNAKRVMATSVGALAGSAAAIGLGFTVGKSVQRGCIERRRGQHDQADAAGFGDSFACSMGGATAAGSVMLVAMPIGLTLGSYLPHQRLGGRGRWWASFAGSAVGLGAGIGTMSMTLGLSDADHLVAATVAGALVATALPVLAIEWSHSRQTRVARADASARKATIRPLASVLQGGGWLGLGGSL